MSSEFQKPILTIDVVLFTMDAGQLRVGLLRRAQEPFKGHLALVGGYVHADKDQTARHSALRVLADKASLAPTYLEQLATFSSMDRDPRGWSASIIYSAMIPEEEAKSADKLTWVNPDQLPEGIGFDHAEVIQCALKRLRDKSLYSPLPLFLFGRPFSIPEAKAVYEQVLGTAVKNVPFRDRMTRFDSALEPVEGLKKPGGVRTEVKASRPAQLYRFKESFQQNLQLWDEPLRLLS